LRCNGSFHPGSVSQSALGPAESTCTVLPRALTRGPVKCKCSEIGVPDVTPGPFHTKVNFPPEPRQDAKLWRVIPALQSLMLGTCMAELFVPEVTETVRCVTTDPKTRLLGRRVAYEL
jgi:hypothetical protein